MALVDPQFIPYVNQTAQWFFTLINGIPARFFYYNDGSGGFRPVMAMRCKDYYPEMLYSEAQVYEGTLNDNPVPSEAVWCLKQIMFLMTDNVYVPWAFELPTDAQCETIFTPNIFYDLREIVPTFGENGEVVSLTHVQPYWIPLWQGAVAAFSS